MPAHARYRSVGGAVVLLALAAAAQQPTGQEPLIRITVGLVQVDAVVTDSRGRIVEDLKAEDFELLQDGKPRPITRFAFVRLADAAAGRQPKVDSGPLPAPAIRPEQVRRTIVCLVDDLGISPGAMLQVREGLRKFVREQIQPADLVSIVRTGSGMGALQTLTNNKEQLLATIDRLAWNPMSRTASRDRGEQPSDLPAAQTSTAAGAVDPAGEQIASLDATQNSYFALGSVATLQYAVKSLAKMPGRKSVIFFSEGLPLMNEDQIDSTQTREAVRRLIEEATRASVVLYTIEPGGLATLTPRARDDLSRPDSPGTGSRIEQLAEERRFRQTRDRDGLDTMARDTGGLFLRDANTLDGPLAEILQDQGGFYLLGYDPEDETFDRKFHKIEVRVKRRGLRVRSRAGFTGEEEAATVSGSPSTTEGLLREAILSPFQTGDLRVKLTAHYMLGENGGPVVSCLAHIDLAGVEFRRQEDGKFATRLDVVAASFNEVGEGIDQTYRNYPLRMSAEVLAQARETGLLFLVQYPIRHPGPYQVRAVVRDGTSRKLGSASHFLMAPDLAAKKLAVSGMTMHRSVPELDRGTGNAGARVFKVGQEVLYVFEVYNAKLGAEGAAKLVTSIRLIENGRVVYQGKAAAVSAKPPDPKRVVANGTLRLGGDLKPGDYVLQLTVRDSLGGGRAVATQWTDFRIVR